MSLKTINKVMNLELYESKAEQDLRKGLEKKVERIIELQDSVRKNPNDEGLRNELKFYIKDMEYTIEFFYITNNSSNFYSHFLHESVPLTRKEKVEGVVSRERAKFLAIKSAIRQAKANVDKRHSRHEIAEME